MCISVCMYIYTYKYIHIDIHTHICICSYEYIYIYYFFHVLTIALLYCVLKSGVLEMVLWRWCLKHLLSWRWSLKQFVWLLCVLVVWLLCLVVVMVFAVYYALSRPENNHCISVCISVCHLKLLSARRTEGH